MNPLPQDALEAAIEPVATESWPVVPDLISLGLGEACATAAWADASVSATSVTRIRGPWGVVVAQSPPPGARLKGLWRIHVLVSAPPSAPGSDAG